MADTVTKKRILHIPNYYYPHIGGIEQVARDVVKSLEPDEYEQKVICFNEDAAEEIAAGNSHVEHSAEKLVAGTDTAVQPIIDRRKENAIDIVDGIEVIKCGCFIKKFSQSLSTSYAGILKRTIKEFKPDIIVFHYPNPFVTSFMLGMLPKDVKLIVYWHLDITKQKILGKLFKGQNMKLLRRADKVVATSPNYVEGSPFLSQFREKCIVVPNCMNEERLAETEESKRIAKELRENYPDKIICLAVGRQVWHKGFDYLVRASKALDDRFVFLLCGDGPEHENLIKLAENDEKVLLPGRISDDELIAYYSACDVFCFPSLTKSEAFGLVLAEAMSFGKPALTFTIPGSGVNYVSLDKVTGIECLNGDQEALMMALKELADNSELREKYGKAAKARVEENFLYKQFVDEIRELTIF